ncbi:MarR family EPS-associated transcriptional regulator [Marinospirillum minutulum]|uniref:MarR family EPS-associated transcriptional regulator n=1 Tax=Marinospirillum minutulum TaxID=64974 RepID=UPI00040591D8|nr:MarR family EPS-associated transcriptional regulator [Marinospirillum minutulum]
MVNDTQLRIMRILENNQSITQRELAKELGLSLGRTNFHLQALAEKGWMKMGRFCKSSNKRAYLYQLTPKGLREKAAITLNFLRRKEVEYQQLSEELEKLRQLAEEDQLAAK